VPMRALSLAEQRKKQIRINLTGEAQASPLTQRIKDMDYVEAFEVIAQAIGDMRRRIIALEAKGSVASGSDDRLAELEASIELLSSRVDDIDVEEEVETAIDAIDWEEHVREALRGISLSVIVD